MPRSWHRRLARVTGIVIHVVVLRAAAMSVPVRPRLAEGGLLLLVDERLLQLLISRGLKDQE